MADVTVTFATPFPTPARVKGMPAPVGSSARSETITAPATSAISASEGDHMVRVTASADCWVAIGASPATAAATDGTREAWLVKADAPHDFHVETGDSVAVEAAA